MLVGRFGPAQAGGEAVVFRELRQLASAQLRRGCRRSGFDWEAFIGDGPEWGVTEVIHRRAVQRGVVQRPDDVSADDVLAVVREVVSEWSNEPDLRPTYEGFCQEQARRGEKGRGTQRSQAALREAQVLELVAGGVTSHAEIGRRVGVHRCTVGRILARVAAARGANADATVVAPAEPVPFPAPEIPRWERWPVHQFMKQTGVMLDADDARWLAGMGRCYEAEGRVDDLMYAIGASAGSAVFNPWAYLQRCVSNRGDAWTASPQLLADVLVWAGEDSLRYALTTIATGYVRRRQVPVDAVVPPNCVGAACCIGVKGVTGNDYNYLANNERVLEPSLSTVYPRVCGGTVVCRRTVWTGCGLSLRVRGKRVHRHGAQKGLRSIPACAGETPLKIPKGAHVPVYPRVCGGTMSVGYKGTDEDGLSPSVRGNRRGDCPMRWPGRSYPRVCGGTRDTLPRAEYHAGLSPRVRGNHFLLACHSLPLSVYPRVCGGTRRRNWG